MVRAAVVRAEAYWGSPYRPHTTLPDGDESPTSASHVFAVIVAVVEAVPSGGGGGEE